MAAREEIEYQISILQAVLDGGPVQRVGLPSGEWVDDGVRTPDFHKYNYRIKPEPREFWGNEYDNGSCKWIQPYDSEEVARGKAADDAAVRATVHYREVI